MINTDELMRYNYVICSGIISEVVEIANVYIRALNDGFGTRKQYYQDQIAPIPITPAVLEACSLDIEPFKSHIYQNLMRDGSGVYDGYFMPCKYSIDRVYMTLNIHIKSLHQLQNLYFAMTQKPLEIDIEKLKTAIL